MTDRQFGFLLKMASEIPVDSHLVVKLAAPGDYASVLGESGMKALETARRGREVAAARAREEARADREYRKTLSPIQRSSFINGGNAVTRSTPVISTPARSAAPAPARSAAPTPARSAAPVAAANPAPYGPKRYGDTNYFNDRYKMYKDIATKYEANANAGKEKKKEEFNPGTVQNGAGFTSNRSNSLLDRVNALKAERARQAASGTDGPTTVSESPAAASKPGPGAPNGGGETAAPAAPTARRNAPASSATTGQWGEFMRSFDALPQGRKLSLLENAGIDLESYMNASPTVRQRMVMNAYKANAARRRAAASPSRYYGPRTPSQWYSGGQQPQRRA